MRVVAVASWVIYAILGVLVLLIVWRVLREWTHTTDQAANLRTAVFIMGLIYCRSGSLAFHDAVTTPTIDGVIELLSLFLVSLMFVLSRVERHDLSADAQTAFLRAARRRCGDDDVR
jgi:hypothetical protein